MKCAPSNLSDAFFNFDQYSPRSQISSNLSSPLLKPSFSFSPNDINDPVVSYNFNDNNNYSDTIKTYDEENSLNEPFENMMLSQIRHSSTAVPNSFHLGNNYSQNFNISALNNPMNHESFNNGLNIISGNNSFTSPMNNTFSNSMNNINMNSSNSILIENGESRVYYSHYQYIAAQLYEHSLKKELELLISKGDIRSEIKKRTEEYNYIYVQLQTATGFIPLSLDPEDRDLIKVKFHELKVLEIQTSQFAEIANEEEEDTSEQDPTIFENCLSLSGQCSALAKTPDAKELHAINIKLNSARIRACIHNSQLRVPYKLCKYGLYSITIHPDEDDEAVQRDNALIIIKQTMNEIKNILHLNPNDDVISGIQNFLNEKEVLLNNYKRIGEMLEIPGKYDQKKIEDIIQLEHEVYSTLEPLFQDNIVASVINLRNENQLLKEMCNYDSNEEENINQNLDNINNNINNNYNNQNIENYANSEKSKGNIMKNNSFNFSKDLISQQDSTGKLSRKLLEKMKNKNESEKTIMWMTEQGEQ